MSYHVTYNAIFDINFRMWHAWLCDIYSIMWHINFLNWVTLSYITIDFMWHLVMQHLIIWHIEDYVTVTWLCDPCNELVTLFWLCDTMIMLYWLCYIFNPHYFYYFYKTDIIICQIFNYMWKIQLHSAYVTYNK